MAYDLVWGEMVNHAVEDTSTPQLTSKTICFDAKQFLTGAIGPGGDGVWTVVRSSDSVSVANSDLWLTSANVVQANAGSPHSWVRLQNTTLGLECVLDILGADTRYPLGVWFAPVTSPFTGGTTTARPTSGYEFGSDPLNSRFIHLTATPMNLHGLLSERGDFWFFTSINGSGKIYFALGVCQLKNAKTNDLFPWVAYSSGSGSTGTVLVRGTGPVTPFTYGFDNNDPLRTPGFWGRTATGASVGNTSAVDYIGAASLILCYITASAAGAFPLDGSDLDPGDGGSLTSPFLIGISKAGHSTFKGEWPDAIIGKSGVALNTPSPNAIAQEWLKIGDVWLPFTSPLSL